MRPLVILIGLIIAVILVATGVRRLFRMGMQQGYAPAQPIAFSHKLHAGDNQVPCLYCHYGARSSRHAGIPSSSVCMNCHGLLEKQTVEIERFKEAAQLDKPVVAWTKVHNLPDFVYFNHSQHVLHPIACQKCHGPIETMDRVSQVSPLTMGWCINCHRDNGVTPPGQRGLAVVKAGTQAAIGGTDCSKCHY